MQLLALLALIVFLVLLFRWLGPPVRRSNEAEKRPGPNPEEEVPPPTIMNL